MSNKDHDFGSLVCIYAQMLPRIREAAKKLGYAIAIHGSMYRDFDTVAVPWTEDAAPAEELVQAVADEVKGYVIGTPGDTGSLAGPYQMPHGRKVWSICWGGRVFIDFGVMPRVP